ncbi:hypothetical protein CEE36_01535 [candidate division TA06 bacterium B3_TA06]|uniref:Peptidase S8/S53 domain-containing protein n=1 Tax=candidate division TA06 bacterium B3_TA06 TaxID=2012487 RepID=A0A532V9G8_UNCT6|nr:MAG: hypothetical protein CEE36_01535 [candidate division TA06 bacterium B3_TA06]
MMKRLSVILTLTAAMLGFIPSHLAAADDVVDTLGFIVKTQNAEALEVLVEDKGLEIGPLITYPNPSDEVLEVFGCYFIVTIPQELHSIQNSIVDELETLPGVEYVEPNLSIPVELHVEQGTMQESFQNPFNMPDTFDDPYTPNDPMFPNQYGPQITKVDWAWNLSTGEGVKIAILDAGFDVHHEDLIDNLDLENAYDFTDDDTIVDGLQHGTWVTGIAGAKIDNGIGIAGVAGNSSILPLRVIGGSGQLHPYLVKAIIYAADKEARVISMSIGTIVPSQTTEDAIDYVWERGVFVCASAGNSNKDELPYPASYGHVMSVGGTDSEDERWDDGDHGSNFGSNVDVYAPADSIFTTDLDDSYGYPSFPSGTSFSAPHVAGLAALIWDVHPDWTNQQVWDKIIESADTITIDKGKVLRMNACKALDIVPGITEHPVAETAEWKVLSSIGQRIVLKYHDLPQGFHASIFDATGRKVDEIESPAQKGVLTWGENHSPGVYFIVLGDKEVSVQKVILIE